MSFSYERYDRRQRRGPQSASRSAVSYWLPLGLTVATAAIGFAAWIWSEGQDRDEDGYDSGYDDSREVRRHKSDRSSPRTRQSNRGGPEGPAATAAFVEGETAITDIQERGEQAGIVTKVNDAIRRTPSPQQLFDGASKRVAAGVAAAGAAVGRGLSAIKETDGDFQDHERWSAEAEVTTDVAAGSATRGATGQLIQPRVQAPGRPRRRLVALVVSASSASPDAQEAGAGYEIEHASMLSHLPENIDFNSVEIVVLIYAPQLTSYPLSTLTGLRPEPHADSMASSYSNISMAVAEDERPPAQEQLQGGAGDNLYKTLQDSALRVVSNPTSVLPFTTPTGHVHLLRHLAPSLVYMEESLSGPDGENVKLMEGWVGQIVVVVGGEGLIDTETEDEGQGHTEAKGWWKDSTRVGLGKAEIVEGSRFTEDWIRRAG